MEKHILKLAVHGLDQRSIKTMQLFLKGPCHGEAIIVEPQQADFDLIDIDHPQAKDFYDRCLQNHPDRQIVTLSLEKVSLDKTISLTKPVTQESFLHALAQLRSLQVALHQTLSKPRATHTQQLADKHKNAQLLHNDNNSQQSAHQAQAETTHQEKPTPVNHPNPAAFIGILSDIDFSDPQQLKSAHYQAQDYLLGYIKAAINHASNSAEVIQISSSWKTIVIFPAVQRINLAADDKQLRAFAGIKLQQINRDLSFKAIDASTCVQDKNNDQSMAQFLWKLSIWTSRGRYPYKLDLTTPLYLKHWPNFTRLLVTPHALRISALLMQGPRSLQELASDLNISPQYVFVFASACFETGILNQAQRQSDTLVQPPPVAKKPSSNLFRKILNKLHTSISAESQTNEPT